MEYKWTQPKDLDALLERLADARDLNVPERERENLCSVAYETIVKLRDGLAEAIKDLEASGYCYDHPQLVRLRKIIGT